MDRGRRGTGNRGIGARERGDRGAEGEGEQIYRGRGGIGERRERERSTTAGTHSIPCPPRYVVVAFLTFSAYAGIRL